jgi:hypothetical protein
MSRCARDFTNFVFSSSLSDFPSKRQNVCLPKSNNSFSKFLELVVGSATGIGGIFISSIIGYFTFVPKPEGCKAATYLKKRSDEKCEKYCCPLHRRQNPYQRCAGQSALLFEPSGFSVCLGLMASKKQVKCELLAVSS